MVPTIAVHPLRASDHRQPEKATAEAVLLLRRAAALNAAARRKPSL